MTRGSKRRLSIKIENPITEEENSFWEILILRKKRSRETKN